MGSNTVNAGITRFKNVDELHATLTIEDAVMLVAVSQADPHASGRVAIYPGSFDPPTNGHLDIIARGSRLFDNLIVAVLQNSLKQPLFSNTERTELLADAVSDLRNVTVASFSGLLVDFADRMAAQTILRGIRNLSDYEMECQMAQVNRRLRPKLDTVFLMASEQNAPISSRIVKEIASLGGDLTSFVSPAVAARLAQKFATR